MIEILIEGHFVLPTSEQLVCVLYEGAFANEALRNGSAPFQHAISLFAYGTASVPISPRANPRASNAMS